MTSPYYTPPQYPRTQQMPGYTPIQPPETPVTPPPPETPVSPEAPASPMTPLQSAWAYNKSKLQPLPSYTPPVYEGAPADRSQWTMQDKLNAKSDNDSAQTAKLAARLAQAKLKNDIRQEQLAAPQREATVNPYYSGLYGLAGGTGAGGGGGIGGAPQSLHTMEYANNPNLNRYGRFDINLPYGGYAPPQRTMIGNETQPWFPYKNPRSQASSWGSNIYSYKW